MAVARDEAKVKAVVVRGSYTYRNEDGDNITVHPDQGKDSEVMVPPRHLEAFRGILAKPADVRLERAAVQREKKGMAQPTSSSDTTDETTGDDTGGDGGDAATGKGAVRR